VAAVGLSVAVLVLDHDNAVSLGPTPMMSAITHALGDPDASVGINVDVGGVVEERRTRPERDLETLRQFEKLQRHRGRLHLSRVK